MPRGGAFSPGLCAGAFVLVLIYKWQGTLTMWWGWLLALVIAMLVDAMMGYQRIREPKVKTETRYASDDDD